MEKQITILLVDDHQIIREGIRGLLELENDFLVVGEAKDGKECIQKVEELKPDVMLLDINMPIMSGLEALEKLHDRGIQPKTLLLTIHDEIQYLRRAVDLGANGYVLKDSDFNTLSRAIKSVYKGEDFIDKKLLPLFNEKILYNEDETNELTKREREILVLIAKGYINKEIAQHLSISEKTVKNHISNLFKKIDVSDRTQAAVYAIKNNFVDI